MISPVNDAAVEVGAQLLAAPDTASRASIIAAVIVAQLPNCACAVHRFFEEREESAWTIIGVAGDIAPESTAVGSGNRLMAPLVLESPEILIYSSADILREDYAHLHISRSVSSIAYIPLLQDAQLVGAIEVLWFSGTPRLQDLEAIASIVQLATPAILAAEAMESQRQDMLDSLHRMSQLYDLEKSLNATLDLEALTPRIPEKAAAMLPCQAIHLWMFDGEILRLVSSHGDDATVEAGMTQAPGEGYVADMAEEGDPLLIDDPDDERLLRRNRSADHASGISPITNTLIVPLMQDDAEVGVLEAVNREDRPFDDDDQFLMMSMAETVASALKNASLMLAERKLEILKALVEVSGEITSTLRLDRLAWHHRQQPAERAAVRPLRNRPGPARKTAVEGCFGHGGSSAWRHHRGAAESIDALALDANRVDACAATGKNRRGRAERDSGSGCGIFCCDRFSCSLCHAAGGRSGPRGCADV